MIVIEFKIKNHIETEDGKIFEGDRVRFSYSEKDIVGEDFYGDEDVLKSIRIDYDGDYLLEFESGTEIIDFQLEYIKKI